MASTADPAAPRQVGLEEVLPESASLLERSFNRSSYVAYAFIGLLIGTTALVSGLVAYFANVDHQMIMMKQITPADRLITENVLMTLIGATFVQVGAGAILIVQSIFRSDAASATAAA